MAFRAHLRRARAATGHLLGIHRRRARRLDGTCAVILMYHRVLPRAAARARFVEPGMYVTPETFRKHLRWLRDDFRVLPLAEIVSRLASGQPLPPRAVALTFDDGWRDNFEFALPALEEAGAPATVFLVADRVGSAGAFWPDEVAARMGAASPGERSGILADLGLDAGRSPTEALLDLLKDQPEDRRERALERIREHTPSPPDFGRELLDWHEIDTMATRGIAFESHGCTHAILTGLDDERIFDELARARAILRDHGHGRHALLAYPSGAHDDGTRALARRAGYRAAVTTQPGLADPAADFLALPRIGMHDDVSTSLSEFLERLGGLASAEATPR